MTGIYEYRLVKNFLRDPPRYHVERRRRARGWFSSPGSWSEVVGTSKNHEKDAHDMFMLIVANDGGEMVVATQGSKP